MGAEDITRFPILYHPPDRRAVKQDRKDLPVRPRNRLPSLHPGGRRLRVVLDPEQDGLRSDSGVMDVIHLHDEFGGAPQRQTLIERLYRLPYLFGREPVTVDESVLPMLPSATPAQEPLDAFRPTSPHYVTRAAIGAYPKGIIQHAFTFPGVHNECRDLSLAPLVSQLYPDIRHSGSPSFWAGGWSVAVWMGTPGRLFPSTQIRKRQILRPKNAATFPPKLELLGPNGTPCRFPGSLWVGQEQNCGGAYEKS